MTTKQEQLRILAQEQGMASWKSELFAYFMVEAFPNEGVNTGYTMEWITRFLKGDEWVVSDKERKQALCKAYSHFGVNLKVI